MDKNERGRRTKEYTQISSYLRNDIAHAFKLACAVNKVKQSELIEQLVVDWLKTQPNTVTLFENAAPEVTTIGDLVAKNLPKLQECGAKKLDAIARGECIPTKPDFCKITAALGIEGEEKKKLWEMTYKEEPKHVSTNAARSTEAK
ncbi:MAG: hypothetical protein PUP92_00945 [Rhizonema sp. PD38]|nr:hypothetical protein [Rhizonema sp. PD38]